MGKTYALFCNIGVWGCDHLGYAGAFTVTAPDVVETAFAKAIRGYLYRQEIEAAPAIERINFNIGELNELFDKTGITPCYKRGDEACWTTVVTEELQLEQPMVMVALLIADPLDD